MDDVSQYAQERYEEPIEGNDIATEIKKAFFSYCRMIVPPDFTKYEEKIGYCYIYIRNMAELLYKNKVPVPIFSVEPDELDAGIDKEVIDAMCEDIEDFCINWTDDNNVDVNIKAMDILKKAFPDAPLITNIMGIAVGLPDEDETDNAENEEDKKIHEEIEKMNAEIRENQIKQAVIMQAYIKEIKKQNFPINAKEMILNYFKEASKNSDKAWDILTTTPAYFSPIYTDKLLKSGIKEKDIPSEAKKANQKIATFLKNLKV